MTENGLTEYNSNLEEHAVDQTEMSSSDDSGDDSIHGDISLKMDVEFSDDEIDFSLPLKQVLLSVNRAISQRLESIEQQLDHLNHYCQALEEKVENLVDQNLQASVVVKRAGQSTVIVGLPQGSPGNSPRTSNSALTSAIGPNVTLITLNNEDDYPHGSWLGDESNPEMRVRCQIVPAELLHINTTCHTMEKMALTLLDYLFDRDTQACSNISGAGKHKKKQLDPLLVYGIRCHLIHKFGMTEKDWHRIKQNLDSKCRTAFRRKLKGLTLTATQDSESELSMDQTSDGGGADLDQTHTLSLEPTTIGVLEENDLSNVIQGAQVFHTTEGDEIQVLHATPEQIAQIQQTHQIQILTGDHVITESQIIHQVTDSEKEENACVEINSDI